MEYIYLKDIIKEFNLKPIINTNNFSKVKITTSNVNRPGIHLLGYFDTFDTKRIQIFGKGEMEFLSILGKDQRQDIMEKFFSKTVPCVIIARDINPFSEMIESASKYNVPILKTSEATSAFMGALIRYLNSKFAPEISMHGVHVEVYGQGILILGESGIGKSETALELIKRGHGFIADDVIRIMKTGYNTLIGEPPELIKHFIEIRGLGIIDVSHIFGMGAIKERYSIDMVVNLETWNDNKLYDRLGIDDEQIDIMGINVPCVTIPVKPGRNLAVIIEVAAMNQRQKSIGYNAAKTLDNRIKKEIKKKTNNVKIH